VEDLHRCPVLNKTMETAARSGVSLRTKLKQVSITSGVYREIPPCSELAGSLHNSLELALTLVSELSASARSTTINLKPFPTLKYKLCGLTSLKYKNSSCGN
jgi:hypothetical protein